MSGASQLLAGSCYVGMPSQITDSFTRSGSGEILAYFNLNEEGLLEISKAVGGGVQAIAQAYAVPKAARPFSSDIRFISVSGTVPTDFSTGGDGVWGTLSTTTDFFGYSRVGAGVTAGVFDVEIRNSVSLAVIARCRFDFTLTIT